MKWDTVKFVYGIESGTVYKEKIVKQPYLICIAKGRFPVKRVFFGGGGGGGIISEKMGLGKLLGEVS